MHFRRLFSQDIRAKFLPLALLALGLGAMVLFGFIGIGRGGGAYGHDMRYLFGAGEIWEAGRSPYDFAILQQTMAGLLDIEAVGFGYPPNVAPLTMALSAGSLEFAKLLIGFLNLLSLAVLCLFVAKGAGDEAGGGHGTGGYVILGAAVVIGNPFTAHVIWMGQTTLISAACLYAAWLLGARGRDGLAGLLLGLAAFKPQLALLVGLWFVLDRRWLLVSVAAAVTGLMSLWPIVVTGIGGSWGDWLTALGDYQSGIYNLVSFRHVFGLRSLFAAMGIMLPSLLPLAIAATIALYWQRHGYQRIWLINALLMLSFLLIFAHDYDLAPLATVSVVLLMAARGRIGVMVLICALACMLYFPQRIWEGLGLAQMARSREIALLGLLLLYLGLGRVAGAEQTSRAAPPRTAPDARGS